MTRRERKESKLQKRLKWQKSREQKAKQELQAGDDISKHIPLGQPILTGHHSEKRHRKDLKKITNHTKKAVEHREMAKLHKDKANNLKRQLDTTIFSDDPDAVLQLKEKIARLTKNRDRMKLINKAIRALQKGKKWPEDLILSTEEKKVLDANNQAWGKYIFPGYMLTNIGQRIQHAERRLEELQEE